MTGTPVNRNTMIISVFASLLLLSPCPGRADKSSIAEKMVDEYYSQFQKPGFHVDALLQYYADDVLFTDPTFEIVAEGKSEVRKLYADLGTERTAYKNIRWTIEDVVAQNDIIVIRGKWSGRFHDCDFEVDFITLWRLLDGKIAEQDDFFAASTFDRQVGWNGTTATCNAG